MPNKINLEQYSLFHCPTCFGQGGLSSERTVNISENY